ncbi:Bacterial surface protein 26-residue repeat [uncultured Caudovirales phage]|uniref:Bacterial surface protein 26-residue repeat n=1 Tax=uncultured Caudovirales phage TaxID=2100421 RepID=A0A6J5P9A8_9CAUD|nr:Bacterial surface protein 26-residue repeat [uncultured Caudovirales phage]CAB4160573.1 Bacterial surface protein 26-residue repeat [uncultured Caudovirales phage]CAB4165991.1 Bacterial surface protein 26-residue repeat [uncultured Caudovirales phage]
MAIVTFQAKLYTGIRCLCVDKNIRANLSSAFTVGNYDIDFPPRPGNPSGDVPDLDVNGNPIIYPNIYPWRLRKATADLQCSPAITLVDQKLVTVGSGNTVNDGYFVTGQTYKIKVLGNTDWNSVAGTEDVTYQVGSEFTAQNNGQVPVANENQPLSNPTPRTGIAHLASWTIRSTLTCQFPTYIEIDVEKLGLPEGTDCIVYFEEGFLLEDKGNLLPSGGYEYPNAVQGAPSPRIDNFIQFRTPWYGLSFMTATFNRVFLPTRIKQLSATFPQALGSVTFRIRYNRGNLASLFFPIFTMTPTARKTARAVADLISRVDNGFENWNPETGGLINYRTRYFTSNNNIVSAVSNTGMRIRYGVTDLTAPATISASGDRSIGPITASITSSATMITNAVKITNMVETEPVISSLSATITKTTGVLTQNLQVISSLSGDGSVPMVFTWTTTSNNQRRALPVYFGNINAKVTWGDGTTTTHTSSGPAPNYAAGYTNTNSGIGHTYATPGTYTVTISGTIQNWGFTSSSQWGDIRDFNTHYNSIVLGLKVISWGYIGLETLVGAHTNILYQSAASRAVPSRIPPTVKDLSWMFYHSYADTPAADWSNNNIANWDVSNVENMTSMFYRCRGGFNTNLGSWNTANVTNMSSMFYFTSEFQGLGIENWNTGNVTNMSNMFYQSQSFNRNINNWNVSKVTNFYGMFAYAYSSLPGYTYSNTGYNQSLSKWDVSSATNMELMLYTGFNTYHGDLTYWCVSNIASEPPNFALSSSAVGGGFKPYWGTCPGTRPIVSSVTVDDSTTVEGQTITLTVNVSNVSNATLYYRVNFDYTGNWEYPNNFGSSNYDPDAGAEPDDLNIFTGSISIVNGVGTLTINIADNFTDIYPEPTEYFRVDILSRPVYVTPTSINDFVLGSSPVISIAP